MPGKPKKLVIGVWQGRCYDNEPERNFARAAEVIDEAADAGCDFVCMPEGFLTGYGTREIVTKQAIPLDDKRLLGLARLAGKRRIVALVGLSERRGRKIYNTEAVLDRGRVAGTYSKTMLTEGNVEAGYAPGDTIPVFRAKGVCFGIQICHDTSFPELTSTLSWKGARILFTPHYNHLPSAVMNDHRIRVRNNHVGLAAHYSLVVARSNVVVSHIDGSPGYGDSAIFAPSGSPIVEAGLFTEKLIFANVAPYLTKDRWRSRKELRPSILDRLDKAARKGLADKHLQI